MMNFQELYEIVRTDFDEKRIVDDLGVYRYLFESDADFEEFWKRVGCMFDDGIHNLLTIDIHFRNNPIEKKYL